MPATKVLYPHSNECFDCGIPTLSLAECEQCGWLCYSCRRRHIHQDWRISTYNANIVNGGRRAGKTLTSLAALGLELPEEGFDQAEWERENQAAEESLMQKAMDEQEAVEEWEAGRGK